MVLHALALADQGIRLLSDFDPSRRLYTFWFHPPPNIIMSSRVHDTEIDTLVVFFFFPFLSPSHLYILPLHFILRFSDFLSDFSFGSGARDG